MTERQTARIAGVDEAGRGPLAGPVVAAAVILRAEQTIPGLADSKKLGANRRQALAAQIRAEALACCVARASVEEIDELNILHATLLAMQRAVSGLSVPPDTALVDGNKKPDLVIPAETVVGGDAKVAAISAASILAKVERDREMIALEQTYPGYGFAQHKGYGTKAHREALLRLGATPLHRRSFAPVQQAMADSATPRAV